MFHSAVLHQGVGNDSPSNSKFQKFQDLDPRKRTLNQPLFPATTSLEITLNTAQNVERLVLDRVLYFRES